MKKYSAIIMMTAVLLGAGMAMTTACIDSIEPEQPKQTETPQQQEKKPQVLTLTIQAEKVEAPETKGLVIDGSEAATTVMKSVWREGEVVDVYKNGSRIGYLTAGSVSQDGRQATLTGTTTEISNGDQLTLLTSGTKVTASPISWGYTGQKGVLLGEDAQAIQNKYNYALAENVTATVNGETVTTTPASFKNQQNIYRFSFRKTDGTNKTAITATKVTITSANLIESCEVGTTGVTDTKSTTGIQVDLGTDGNADPFFVALRINGSENEALQFQVIEKDSGITYTGSKEIGADEKQGKFISFKNATLSPMRLTISSQTTQNVL